MEKWSAKGLSNSLGCFVVSSSFALWQQRKKSADRDG
jgi:hypothetical protein